MHSMHRSWIQWSGALSRIAPSISEKSLVLYCADGSRPGPRWPRALDIAPGTVLSRPGAGVKKPLGTALPGTGAPSRQGPTH